MNLPKIIFDTNFIRTQEEVTASFFGNKSDLESFAAVGEIIIPDIVIEEIKAQKIKHFTSKRDSFKSNPYSLFVGSVEAADAFDIENHVNELLENAGFNYKTIYLENENALDEIKRRCLDCTAPFQPNSDKGFKDTYLFLTIIDYIKTLGDEKVFFVTSDEKLREAFAESPQVILLKSFEEYEKYNTVPFTEDYFVKKLAEEINIEGLIKEQIQIPWLNINDNWVVPIITLDENILVEVDFASRDILCFTSNNVSEMVDNLKNSGSFQSTHNAIAEIRQYINFLTDKQIKDLLVGAIHNEQIYWISSDQDVEGFFDTLFQARYYLLDSDEYDIFKHYFSV